PPVKISTASSSGSRWRIRAACGGTLSRAPSARPGPTTTFSRGSPREKLRSCVHRHCVLSRASCRLGNEHPRPPSRIEQRPRMADDRRMKSASRPQRRYDHRLRDLVRRTGDLTIATDLGVPRSTARGWLAAASTVVISVDVASLTEAELRQEILKLRQRVEKLAALLRWPSPCCKPPGSSSQAHVCRRAKPSCG